MSLRPTCLIVFMVVSSTPRLGGYGLGVIEAHLVFMVVFNTKAGWIWARVIEAHLPESIHGGQFNTKAGWIWARCHCKVS